MIVEYFSHIAVFLYIFLDPGFYSCSFISHKNFLGMLFLLFLYTK